MIALAERAPRGSLVSGNCVSSTGRTISGYSRTDSLRLLGVRKRRPWAVSWRCCRTGAGLGSGAAGRSCPVHDWPVVRCPGTSFARHQVSALLWPSRL